MSSSSLSLPANTLDPFTQEEVNALTPEERIDLFDLKTGLCVRVQAACLLQYITVKLSEGVDLTEVEVLTDHGSVLLSKEVWVKCLLPDTRFLNLFESAKSCQTRRRDSLEALHRNSDLFGRVQIFIHDLLTFGSQNRARDRLELNSTTASFYMSEIYFSEHEIEYLMSFPGANGTSLRNTLERLLDSKKEAGLCTSHDIAPVLL